MKTIYLSLFAIILFVSCKKDDTATPTIKLSSNEIKLFSNETSQLSATVTPLQSCTWISFDASIATVSQTGLVTGLKSGKTNITAKVSGSNVSDICVVTVIEDVLLNTKWIADDIIMNQQQHDKNYVQLEFQNDRTVIKSRKNNDFIYGFDTFNYEYISQDSVIVKTFNTSHVDFSVKIKSNILVTNYDNWGIIGLTFTKK